MPSDPAVDQSTIQNSLQEGDQRTVTVNDLSIGARWAETPRDILGMEPKKGPVFVVTKNGRPSEFRWYGRALWSFLNEAQKRGDVTLAAAATALPDAVQSRLNSFGGASAFLASYDQQAKLEAYASSPMLGVRGAIDAPRVTNGTLGKHFLALQWDADDKAYVEDTRSLKGHQSNSEADLELKGFVAADLSGRGTLSPPQDIAQIMAISAATREGRLNLAPDAGDGFAVHGGTFTILGYNDTPGVVASFVGFEQHGGTYKLAREGHLTVQPDGRAGMYTLDSGHSEFAWAGAAVLLYDTWTRSLRKEQGGELFGHMEEHNENQGAAARGAPWGGMEKMWEAHRIHAALNAFADDGLTVSSGGNLSDVAVGYPATADKGVAGKTLMVLKFKEHGIELHHNGTHTGTAVYGDKGFERVARVIAKIGAEATGRPDVQVEAARVRWGDFTKAVAALEGDMAQQRYVGTDPKAKAWQSRLVRQGDVLGSKAVELRNILYGGGFTGQEPAGARAKLHFWTGDGQTKLFNAMGNTRREDIRAKMAAARGGEAR